MVKKGSIPPVYAMRVAFQLYPLRESSARRLNELGLLSRVLRADLYATFLVLSRSMRSLDLLGERACVYDGNSRATDGERISCRPRGFGELDRRLCRMFRSEDRDGPSHDVLLLLLRLRLVPFSDLGSDAPFPVSTEW